MFQGLSGDRHVKKVLLEKRQQKQSHLAERVYRFPRPHIASSVQQHPPVKNPFLSITTHSSHIWPAASGGQHNPEALLSRLLRRGGCSPTPTCSIVLRINACSCLTVTTAFSARQAILRAFNSSLGQHPTCRGTCRLPINGRNSFTSVSASLAVGCCCCCVVEIMWLCFLSTFEAF